MKTVNMHEARTHLPYLVEEAAQGEPLIIARAGKPFVNVVMVGAGVPRRSGFSPGRSP